jgi:hypothetical protein
VFDGAGYGAGADAPEGGAEHDGAEGKQAGMGAVGTVWKYLLFITRNQARGQLCTKARALTGSTLHNLEVEYWKRYPGG